MGIPHSGEATRRLDEVCRWSADPDEFAAQLGQAFRHLPEHVITASLGLGSRVAELVGVEPWPGLFGTWIDVAKASGVDLDAAPHPGGRAALFSLAGNGDVAAIEAMAAAGASVRVRSQDGDEPVGEAVGSGRIDAYRRLVELGADLAFVNAKGETLLHRAAERVKVDTYAETFLSLARELLAAGVDPAQKNEHGNTAGWYIASYCHDREDTDHAFDEVEQGEIETLAMEIEESGWRARP